MVGCIYGRSSVKIAHFVLIHSQIWPPQAIFVSEEMSNIYRGPSIDASYHASDNLAKRFKRRRFLEIDQSETRIACGGHVC
jgi:hypothetical protein